MTLNDYIIHNGLSLEGFALKIGVSRQAVARYRKGERLPEPDAMAKIVSVTGGQVTPNDFYGLTVNPPSSNDTPARAAAAGE